MKVYLVTTCSLPMVGIEKCQAYAVYPAYEAAFIRQYASRILTSGNDLYSILPLSITIYKGH